jgi:uncharacterized protein (DUF427 family)
VRPPQADEPGPGQESVWDYPRPPRLERSAERIRIKHTGVLLADTKAAWRMLETSQAPAYYLPAGDVEVQFFEQSASRSMCEWKGAAVYFDLIVGDTRVLDAAWTYQHPSVRYAEIANHMAVYPQLLDECSGDGELVRSNEGSFYGGWVTSRVAGPFKGAPGTLGW